LTEEEGLKSVFRKRGEIVSREIAGETILVPIKGKLADMQQIFSLNSVAAYVWDHLDGQKDSEKLLAELMDHFDVGREEAERDIHEFVEELLKAGLIEAANR
jgi:Coenzyme PQQ synthesis protein D (PqqD)